MRGIWSGQTFAQAARRKRRRKLSGARQRRGLLLQANCPTPGIGDLKYCDRGARIEVCGSPICCRQPFSHQAAQVPTSKPWASMSDSMRPRREPASMPSASLWSCASVMFIELRSASAQGKIPRSEDRIIAGLSGFFTLSQSRDGPDR